MAYKQGIPLLEAFEEGKDHQSDEEDSEDESPFTPDAVKIKASKGRLGSEFCTWKHWLFLGLVTMIVLVILLLAVTLPFALIQEKPTGTTTPQPTATPLPTVLPVTKSPHDSRDYGYFTLDNGLRVLLVSDNETQLSAAAMDVAVGSFSDPPSHLGLAHFCEHMLFYASDKYPQEGAYSDYLSRHGGYDNAYTSTENTNYFFRVGSEYLHEALDRFAQFFISPILSQSGVSREVNAVDSEHRKNLQDDGWRLWQLLKHISNPYHPFHQFNTGDLETLDKPDVLSALKDFYYKYYSANQMQLVIYGKEDLVTLSQYTVSMFSSIRNNNASRVRYLNTSFSPPFNGKIVYYVPVADVHMITMYWQVMPLKEKYREKIASILSQLLGHEGTGSPLHYLKKQQWAISISAGTEFSADSYTVLGIYITLTQSGLAHSKEVIGTVMQYIKLLQGLTEQQWRQQWNDYVDVAVVNFNFSSKISPDKYTSNLASTMRTVKSPRDFLGSPQRYIFNHTLISAVVSSLSPSTPIIFVGSHNLSNPQTSTVNLPLPGSLSSTEPIYGTKYDVEPVSSQLVSDWLQYSVVLQELSLPKQNEFIPRDFIILNTSTATSQPMEADPVYNGYSVWWQQDKQFLQPKLNLVCNIYSPITKEAINDPRWTALTELYANIVLASLNPLVYPATLLDYSVSVKAIPHGLNIAINGYSDSTVMNKIIELVVNAMTNDTLLSNPEIFSLTLESMTDALSNYNFTALPYHYIYQYIQSVVMDRPMWKKWQLLNALQDFNVSEVLSHKASLLESATLLCLVHGNVDKTQAIRYGHSFFTVLSSSTMIDPTGTLAPRRRILLSPGNYSVIVPALNPMDHNSVINVVFQIGVGCNVTTLNNGLHVCTNSSLKRTAIVSLLTLQIQQSCFDVLRTKQQLGYVAYCTLRTNNNVLSFQILVQSGTYNASLLLERIDQFLKDSLQNVTEFLTSSTSNFESLVQIYHEVLRRKDLSLSDVTARLWNQIDTGLNQFNYKQQLETALQYIQPNELIQFYKDYILDSGRAKKLVVAAYGKDKKETLDSYISNELDYTRMDPSTISYP